MTIATACRRGHGFTPENTRVHRDGTRRCKACMRAGQRRRDRERQRAIQLAKVRARSWPIRVYWCSHNEALASDLTTPGYPGMILRGDLLSWQREGWVVRTARMARGRFGCWETFDLTDAGQEAVGT